MFSGWPVWRCVRLRAACFIMVSVELASKEVQRELDETQKRLNEFLAAEENAMKERIR